MTLVIRPAHDEELGSVGELTFAAYAADGFITEDEEYAGELAVVGAFGAVRHRAEQGAVLADRDVELGLPTPGRPRRAARRRTPRLR